MENVAMLSLILFIYYLFSNTVLMISLFSPKNPNMLEHLVDFHLLRLLTDNEVHLLFDYGITKKK